MSNSNFDLTAFTPQPNLTRGDSYKQDNFLSMIENTPLGFPLMPLRPGSSMGSGKFSFLNT